MRLMWHLEMGWVKWFKGLQMLQVNVWKLWSYVLGWLKIWKFLKSHAPLVLYFSFWCKYHPDFFSEFLEYVWGLPFHFFQNGRYPLYENFNFVVETRTMAHILDLFMLNNFKKDTYSLKCVFCLLWSWIAFFTPDFVITLKRIFFANSSNPTFFFHILCLTGN